MADSSVAPYRTMRRRASFAAITGTSIAFYDFFLYSTAVQLVFAPAFAQSGDPYSRWLIGASPFVGFAARPVGAMLFSHWGDRIGRKSTLIATLLTMGLPTAAIGLVPLHAGIWSGVSLTVFRLLQGIGLGGEWAGSVLLSMEWEPERDRQGFAASLPQLGVPLGLVLGTGILFGARLLLSPDQFAFVGWRLPFLLGLLLVGFGLYIRLGVHETPVFTELAAGRQLERRPVLRVVEEHRPEVALAAMLRMSADVGFYVFTTFAFVYVTQRAGQAGSPAVDRLTNDLVVALLLGSAVAVFAVPMAGKLADWFGRKPVYGAGIAGLALYAWPFFLLLDSRDPGVMVMAMVLALVLHSVQFGPQAAMIAGAFAPQVRYSGASLSYQLAPVVAGGWALPIATLLLQTFHSSLPIALYMVGYCVISAVALRRLRPTPYRYEVALSYAGEDRGYVQQVARALRRKRVPLYYDRDDQASLWGKDLSSHLRAVYGEQSRFVVLFVSQHYAEKAWTRRELRIARERVREECLLPVRLDDTDLPGLSASLAYIDGTRTTPAQLASLIVEKLGRYR